MTRFRRFLHVGLPFSSPDAARERGFTLVEILITLVISPLVIGAIVVVLITVFAHQSSVTNALSGSEDAQVASATFVSDVQSAAYVTTEATPSCGVTGSQILGLKLSDQAVTSYVLFVVSGHDELIRENCTLSNVTSPATSVVLSTNVPSTTSVQLMCTVASTCSTLTTWVSGSDVANVSLSVSELTTGVSYEVTGTPRLWNAASEGGETDPFPVAPLEILGGTCPQTALNLSGGASITASGGGGGIIDDSTCTPSINLSGSAVINAASISVDNSTPSTSVSASGSASYPKPVDESPTPNPFTTLSAPTDPTTSLTGSCPTSGSGTCTPGNFASSVSFSGVQSISTTSGVYVFDGPVSVSNSATVTFGTGTYVFEQGLTVSGAAVVSLGSGTYIFEGANANSSSLTVSGSGSVTSGSGGVLLYVQSGQASFSGAGIVSITGEAAYDGIALWQAATDTNNFTFSGSSGLSDSYGGIYVPGATAVPSGAAALSAAFVVADAVDFSGSAALNLG